ncbi:hypothetical protein GQ600_1457 [Phytophthora cactorum]|nr:hypothetical protein GQ600_1457 [Phytophthora cactorum]
MKFTFFVATFLAIASAAQAGDPQNAIQLSASAQDDHADVVLATPAPRRSQTFRRRHRPTSVTRRQHRHTPRQHRRIVLTQSWRSVRPPQPPELSAWHTRARALSVWRTPTTRAEYEAEKSSSNDSSSSATVPIAVVGCLVGVLGMVAAVVIVRKRKGAAEEGETDYSNGIRTPASVKAEEAYANIIHTPAAGEAGEVEYSNAIHTPVATV